MDPNKRIIDLTVFDLQLLFATTIEHQIKKALSEKYNQDLKNRVLSINELAALNIVGKYHKIKSLLAAGHLSQTEDGKISGLSVFNYLNNLAA